MTTRRTALNAWRPEKTARMLALYDANPTREGIAEIAEEFGVGVPAIRLRLNTHGRYIRQPYDVIAEHRVEPVTRAKWPDLGPNAFKGYTREDMAIAARLEMAVRG